MPETGKERRWKIWRWDAENSGVEGPDIAPEQDGLSGLDWVRAARVEVMEVAEHLAEVERIQSLEKQGSELLAEDAKEQIDGWRERAEKAEAALAKARDERDREKVLREDAYRYQQAAEDLLNPEQKRVAELEKQLAKARKEGREEVREAVRDLAAEFEAGGAAERDNDEPGVPSSVYYHAAELLRERLEGSN